MKHAYLIIAHNEFVLLQCLVRALDDERNDVFIHFDKKVERIPTLITEKAGLFFTQERVDVRWGDVSVVEAEYVLFSEAVKRGPYSYYHLMSGVDLPLKGQDEIHRFFDRNQEKEFIGFSQYDYNKELDRKVRKYHLFPKDFRPHPGILGLLKKTMRFLFVRLQYLVDFQRHKNINFKKGTQWVSITHNFVIYLLTKQPEVKNTYQHTFCADEIYKQTLCWNSSFRSNIYDLNDEGIGCMRRIGWADGQLFDWTEENYEELIQSKALFARKFSSKHMEVVHRILNNLK